MEARTSPDNPLPIHVKGYFECRCVYIVFPTTPNKNIIFEGTTVYGSKTCNAYFINRRQLLAGNVIILVCLHPKIIFSWICAITRIKKVAKNVRIKFGSTEITWDWSKAEFPLRSFNLRWFWKDKHNFQDTSVSKIFLHTGSP